MRLISPTVTVTVMMLVVGLTVVKLLPERTVLAIPQQAPALSIAVNPAIIDAVRGQTTTVTFTNTVKVYKPRVEVRNSSGATIRTLASWSMIGTNTFTRVWDGKNSSGKVVADGAYTVIFYGNNANKTPLTPAIAGVTVATNPAGLSISVAPNTIDPSKGQTTTITFRTTIAAYQPRLEVRNSGGTVVRTLGTWSLIGSNNTLTRTWDGKSISGAIVPDGVYTVVFTGNAVNGAVLTPASATVTVTSVYAFAITGITPGAIDPRLGETTTVTYTVPVTCDLRVFVKNAAGAEVRTLAQLTGATPGAHTATWDAQDGAGTVVPNGTYTVTVERFGTTPTITPASGTVTVLASLPPAFTLTSITPATIDPTWGGSTTITYEVPVVADYRVYVKNAAGTEVRILLQQTAGAAGTHTTTWDARNAAGAIVENGTYSVVIEGLNASAAILPASGTVAVQASPTPAFTITSILPATIDPTKGESATITYEVPVTADYRLYVKSETGAEVRTLRQATAAAAGTYTAAWDARDGAGAVAPNGAYTVTIEGNTAFTTLVPASGTVSVSASPPAFTITSILPATIDPTIGEHTTITYEVPVVADYRVSVRDNTGVEVRVLLQQTAEAAGTHTATWDAKDAAGAVAPNGAYTVTVEGINASADLIPATGSVTVAASPPPAFTITSILPATIDPTNGETTTITYEVPVMADYRLYVKNNAGTEVRLLRQVTAGAAGAATATWDAKDGTGAVAPDGNYTIVIEGNTAFTTITPASGVVYVSASIPAFTITSIVPGTIDPTKSESTTITFEVPIVADYRVFVSNVAGTEVRTLIQQTAGAAGTHTAMWDANDAAGAVVPDGTYTITVEGINASANITAATGSVDVSASPPPTFAFTIVSIEPGTIDPTTGDTTTVTYDVPIACDLRVFVTNAAGTEVRTLAREEGVVAGTRTAAWDANDATGAVVPDGAYTVTVEGINTFTNITPASGTVSVSASPPPTYAFTITSIMPATVDPTKGESATITYEVPILADYRLYVKDGTGTEVRALLRITAGEAGTYTISWDAKNDAGDVVSDGTYTVTIEGLNASTTITPASGMVSVSASPPPADAFTIISIMPVTIDPTKGESTTITYEVPLTADYRLYVKDTAGAEVRALLQITAGAAGTYTASWDAKNDAGDVVPDGTYTVMIEGLNDSAVITPASGTVSVSASLPPTYAFTIAGIVPATIDPTVGESATITYDVPITADYRMYVKDNAGNEVRVLRLETAAVAGTDTATWDAKDTAGAVVPDGVYTIVLEGLNASAAITPATAVVTVAAGTPTYAFTITGIEPATIDPTVGERTTITVDVPIVADYRLYVKDGTGVEIRTLLQETAGASGAHTATWDAKDAAGAVVPDGTYTVVIEGLNASAAITPASGTVAVAASPLDLGQIVEGAGSSNFDWLKYAGYKLDVAFRAPKDGAITQITLQWKSSSGYGAGNKGIYRFELQTDGDGHFPSGTVIASTDGVIPSVAMDGYADGAFHFPISATLTRGVRYHLVITNTDNKPDRNWSSPNGLMTRVLPWDGTGNRAAVFIDGQWHPFSSIWNPWNTSGGNYVNGHHVPTMLTWDDGSNTGDPYYTSRLAAGAYFYGNACAGQRIFWDHAPVTIHQIGISVKRIGAPADDLIYHFEQVGVGDLATGTIAMPDQVVTVQQWCYAELPSAVTLEQGQVYRLWFESPRSKSSSNCYFTSPVYGELRPAAWLECGFGGTHCYYIYGNNSLSSSLTNADLSFSLQ